MNLSIIGSSRIVEEHIKAAKKLNINIKYIYSSKVNSKNLSKLSDKYKTGQIDKEQLRFAIRRLELKL